MVNLKLSFLQIFMIVFTSNSLNVTWHEHYKPERGAKVLYYDVHYQAGERQLLLQDPEEKPLCHWGARAENITVVASMPRPGYVDWMLFHPNYTLPDLICVDIESLCHMHARSDWIGFRLECNRGTLNILRYSPEIDIKHQQVVYFLPFLNYNKLKQLFEWLKLNSFAACYAFFLFSAILYLFVQIIIWNVWKCGVWRLIWCNLVYIYKINFFCRAFCCQCRIGWVLSTWLSDGRALG